MNLHDDDVHRIAAALPFDERHQLTPVSKQFERVLSSRCDLWDTDATFFISDAPTAESCVVWMSRRRHFKSLHIHFNLLDDMAFAAFLGSMASIARGLNVLLVSAPHLRFEDAIFLGSCDALLALHVDAFSLRLSEFACRALSSTLTTLRVNTMGGTIFPLPAIKMSAMQTLSLRASHSSTSPSSWRVFEDGARFPSLNHVSLRAAPSSIIAFVFENVRYLTSLSLRQCNLVELPNELSTLTSLRDLRASRNSLVSLDHLPDCVSRLDVSHNCLAEHEIGTRTSLRLLDISCNPDIARPHAMVLPNLTNLVCSAIPTQTFFSASTQLRVLNIHARCRGYELNPNTPPLPAGLTTTSKALFIEPDKGFLGVDMCSDMLALARSNPNMHISLI